LSYKYKHINNKNILITGSTNGIGLALAKRLISNNNKIFIVGRNNNYNYILNYLEKDNFEFINCDLSEIVGVKKLIDELKSVNTINLLINNVGSIFFEQELNEAKIEKTFFLNYLSHFIISLKLFDKLEKSNSPHILNVSSNVHKIYELDLNDLENQNNYNYWKAYCKSKLLNIYFTYEFYRKYKDKIRTNCIHPGFINSNFGYKHDLLSRNIIKVFKNIFAKSTNQAAINFDKVLNDEALNGCYLNGGNVSKSSKISYDTEISKIIWKKSLDYLKEINF